MEIKDFKIYRADIKMIDQFVKLNTPIVEGDHIQDDMSPKNFCGKQNIPKEKYREWFNRSNVRIYGLWYKGLLIASAVIILKEHKHKVHLISLLLDPLHGGITIAS